MRLSEIIKYYSNPDVQQGIYELCEKREVIPRYKEGVHGKRPQTIMYPGEVFTLARKGATSFHASQERWNNPMNLTSDITKREMDEMRVGWDLILDIDTKYLEYAKACAELIIEALKFHGIKNYSVKFSGGTGFHIAVPYESFPSSIKGIPVEKLFPEAPIIITKYLREMIKKHLSSRILDLEGNDLGRILQRTNKKKEDILVRTDEGFEFNPFALVEIDTIALSPRHLFRLPYVFNEKTWLISQPIKKIKDFSIDQAKPSNVDTSIKFLNKKESVKNEAKQLFLEAYDWHCITESEETPREYMVRELPEKAIPEQFFPPCVKLIINGLPDGRKRGLFILTNFLRCCAWKPEQIKQTLLLVNENNKPPLKKGYLLSHFKQVDKNEKVYPPPNCNNKAYYLDMGVCKPDQLCSKVKNPVSYAYKKTRHDNKKKRRRAKS